jgi:hypothetical protein
MVNTRIYCQSCGMPVRHTEDCGTDSTGRRNMEYCKNCFQRGEFTEPDISMEKMIERVAIRMNKEMGMDVNEAVNLAVTLIPKLKRWQ